MPATLIKKTSETMSPFTHASAGAIPTHHLPHHGYVSIIYPCDNHHFKLLALGGVHGHELHLLLLLAPLWLTVHGSHAQQLLESKQA
jgi:hypothetical protein